MIFKFQRPMATNSPIPQILVYNQARDIEGIIPMDDNIAKLFGDDFKFYALCRVEGETIIPTRRVEDQPW